MDNSLMENFFGILKNMLNDIYEELERRKNKETIQYESIY